MDALNERRSVCSATFVIVVTRTPIAEARSAIVASFVEMEPVATPRCRIPSSTRARSRCPSATSRAADAATDATESTVTRSFSEVDRMRRAASETWPDAAAWVSTARSSCRAEAAIPVAEAVTSIPACCTRETSDASAAAIRWNACERMCASSRSPARGSGAASPRRSPSAIRVAEEASCARGRESRSAIRSASADAARRRAPPPAPTTRSSRSNAVSTPRRAAVNSSSGAPALTYQSHGGK